MLCYNVTISSKRDDLIRLLMADVLQKICLRLQYNASGDENISANGRCCSVDYENDKNKLYFSMKHVKLWIERKQKVIKSMDHVCTILFKIKLPFQITTTNLNRLFTVTLPYIRNR